MIGAYRDVTVLSLNGLQGTWDLPALADVYYGHFPGHRGDTCYHVMRGAGILLCSGDQLWLRR